MSLFQIRAATVNDVLDIAKVRVDTWKATYRGLVPDEVLDNLSYQSIAERWRRTFLAEGNPDTATFVAVNEQEEIIGIAVCGPEQSGDLVYRGEIYVLYVLPQHQNQGIGRALVTACIRHLVQYLKVETMLIWVIAENPYRKFYESMGGKAIRKKTQEIGGKLILEAGYGWEDIYKLL